MRTLIKVCAMGLVAGAVAACSSADTGAPRPSASPGTSGVAPSPERKAAAAAALAQFREAVAASPATLGLASAAEIDRATLDAELPIYFASAAQVNRLGPAADLDAALGEPRELLHAVRVDGEVKSAVVLARNGKGAWEVTALGRAKLARAVAAAASGGSPPRAIVVVRELDARFLALEAQGRIKLAPVP
jgi:hypothetical protein